MKEQDELGIDRFRRHSEKESPAGNLAVFLFVSLALAVVMLAAPVASPAQVSVGVSVTIGPPAIPVYVQPLCPAPGFIWLPGYWAWDPDFGYYWVPGMWAPAPFVGVLWTPGYWAWRDGGYFWYEGYWGPVVGFYGGINYGYGYTGSGYAGGYWSGNRFYYNQTVNNISVTNITTVYSRPVSNLRPIGASFNGGPGGTSARPTSEQLAAARQKRVSLTGEQERQLKVARSDPKQRASVNHGRPAVAATVKPGVFKGRGVVSATRAGAPYKTPPGGKTAKGEHAQKTPKHGAEMHPQGAAHERRLNEPHPGQRRAETTRPLSPGERTRGRGQRVESGQRFNEPHAGPRQGQGKKAPQKEERKGEKEERR